MHEKVLRHRSNNFMHTSGHGTLFSTVYESTYVVLPLVKYNYINHIHTKKKHVPQSSLFILEDCTTLLFYTLAGRRS